MQVKSKQINLLAILSVIKESRLLWIFSFSILTAVAAQITIPVEPVPFTLQTMMVILAGALLGARNGAYSQIVYLFLGVIGLPVFAQVPDASVGFARLFGPTGGYLLSFPIAAFFTGYLIEKNQNYFMIILSMFLGNVIILLIGTLYLNFAYLHNLSEAIKAGAVVFTVWSVIKIMASAGIYFTIKRKK
jgi:biotin transport system substrate-specific component